MEHIEQRGWVWKKRRWIVFFSRGLQIHVDALSHQKYLQMHRRAQILEMSKLVYVDWTKKWQSLLSLICNLIGPSLEWSFYIKESKHLLIVHPGSCLSCQSVMEKETTASLMMIVMSHVCKFTEEIVIYVCVYIYCVSIFRAKGSSIFYSSSQFSFLSLLRSPPASLMSVLSTCEELCDSILAGVQVGEFAVVQPLSVEYSCILGYLLAWKLLLTFFKSSPSHVSHDSSSDRQISFWQSDV